MREENVVRDKSSAFSVRIVRLAKFLQDKHQCVLADQVLRSGTSIGANISESECAISPKDFLNKLYISLKETNETLYWIEILHRTELIDELQYNSLSDDAVELKKLLVSITKTVSRNISKSKDGDNAVVTQA